jgi:hypothetical protein
MEGPVVGTSHASVMSLGHCIPGLPGLCALPKELFCHRVVGGPAISTVALACL